MKITKIVNTIVPLRIFSSRNMSSLGLVGLFFLLYIIAGGSIGTENLKSVRNSGVNQGFGSVGEPLYAEPQEVQIPQAVMIRQQEERRLADEMAKARDEEKSIQDADWERLNNKLKGITQN